MAVFEQLFVNYIRQKQFMILDSLQAMRRYFDSGTPRSYSFRKEQLKKLKDNTQVRAAPDCQLVFIHFMDSGAIDPDLARCGPINAGNHIQQRGFATA